MKESDTKKLLFHTVHRREVANKQMLSLEQDTVKEDTTAIATHFAPVPLSLGPTIANVNRITIELPFYSKFILIAAFLASYNPAKSDKRFFVKHHGKQRKTMTSMKSKEKN